MQARWIGPRRPAPEDHLESGRRRPSICTGSHRDSGVAHRYPSLLSGARADVLAACWPTVLPFGIVALRGRLIARLAEPLPRRGRRADGPARTTLARVARRAPTPC